LRINFEFFFCFLFLYDQNQISFLENTKKTNQNRKKNPQDVSSLKQKSKITKLKKSETKFFDSD